MIKPRPDAYTLDQYRALPDMVGDNVDNLADDFEAGYQGVDLAELASGMDEVQQQAFYNICFGGFINGVITVINPHSAFNSKFVHTRKKTDAAETQTQPVQTSA